MLHDYVLIHMRIIDRSSEILREEGLISFVYSVKQYLLRRVRSVYYELGSGRVCPICGWEGSQFLPFGVEQRPDSACPDCGSKERHRLMWEYLSREYPFHNDTDVLYFAPVDGLEQKLRRSSVEANTRCFDPSDRRCQFVTRTVLIQIFRRYRLLQMSEVEK